jgi:hypothetical protein
MTFPVSGGGMNTKAPPVSWVRASEVSRLIGVPDRHLAKRLADRGVIRRLSAPGFRPRFALEDVQKLIDRATNPTMGDCNDE